MPASQPPAASFQEWQARVSNLQAIAQRLKALAQETRDGQWAPVVGALVFCVAEMASSLETEASRFTLTTKDYANREGISLRTVQRQCRNHHLPAIMAEDGTWRIRDEASIKQQSHGTVAG